jgi:hypothetical protein
LLLALVHRTLMHDCTPSPLCNSSGKGCLQDWASTVVGSVCLIHAHVVMRASFFFPPALLVSTCKVVQQGTARPSALGRALTKVVLNPKGTLLNHAACVPVTSQDPGTGKFPGFTSRINLPEELSA